MKPEPHGWVILVLTCIVTSIVWIWAWLGSNVPVVGWIVGSLVLSVPAWVGLGQWLQNRRDDE